MDSQRQNLVDLACGISRSAVCADGRRRGSVTADIASVGRRMAAERRLVGWRSPLHCGRMASRSQGNHLCRDKPAADPSFHRDCGAQHPVGDAGASARRTGCRGLCILTRMRKPACYGLMGSGHRFDRPRSKWRVRYVQDQPPRLAPPLRQRSRRLDGCGSCTPHRAAGPRPRTVQ